MSRRVVVAGGAGYIGSHVCVELLNAGYSILVIDNYSNASPIALERVATICGKTLDTLRADLADPADTNRIDAVVSAFDPDSVIMLAGLKAVGDSVADPVRYYRTNFMSMLGVIEAMRPTRARNIVFSSSATVYGDPDECPVTENAALKPANPYGRTKLLIEDMLGDLARAERSWRICNLRYFNPVGAHPSGLIGEDPTGIPNNLFPFIAQVAVGRRDRLTVFGADYPTKDGTGVRDYIHVVDLARGHLAALDYIAHTDNTGAFALNLGAGRGYSVLQAIEAFRSASGREIPHIIAPRRPGDIAEIFADPRRAEALLHWKAEKSLADMCADHWRWQAANPAGYAGAAP